MDGAEIAWRLRRAADDHLDIVRSLLRMYPKLTSPHIASIDSFVAGFSCHGSSALHGDDTEWLDAWTAALISSADQIVADRLSFFDLTNQNIGDPINWHKDLSANKSGPMRHCTFVDYRDFEVFGDCKLVWEPNRHHQLVVLARAFVVTGNTKYANKLVGLIIHWIDNNPFGKGMNWKSPLELGIRLINWVWSLDLIRDSGGLNDEVWTRIQQAVFSSVWDIQRKYSRGSSANNHLIGEAAGVFVAASYFKTLPDAETLAAESRSILEREIIAQTFTDGCTREHAFGYQLFVIQFFTITAIVAERCGEPMSDKYLDRLHRMYDFVAELSRDSGRPPSMGDADDGYVLDLGDKPSSPANLISVGAQLFNDPSLQIGGPSQSCFWLFGRSQFNKDKDRRMNGSIAYPESGYFLLRSSEDTRRDGGASVFFDCAELGYGAIAAHGHADCLSITMSVSGIDIFVDPGTYDYFTYPDWREYFRSTAAHNTLEIDGNSQSISSGPFMWSSRAIPRLLDWSDDERQTSACGEHDGYSSESEQIVHRRRISLDKQTSELSVVDDVQCSESHIVRRYFHLSPECSATRVDSREIHIVNGTMRLSIHHSAARSEIIQATENEKIGWVSTGYHRREKSSCIVLIDEIDQSASLAMRVVSLGTG